MKYSYIYRLPIVYRINKINLIATLSRRVGGTTVSPSPSEAHRLSDYVIIHSSQDKKFRKAIIKVCRIVDTRILDMVLNIDGTTKKRLLNRWFANLLSPHLGPLQRWHSLNAGVSSPHPNPLLLQ